MNRLVILGNGFDLAHGLPTHYEDFMLHYLKNVFKKKHDSFGLIYIKKESYAANFYGFDSKGELSWERGIDNSTSIKELLKHVSSYDAVITIKIQSELLKNLFSSFDKNNWIDIEAEYYRLLKDSFQGNQTYEIKELNKDFETLKSILESYLEKEVKEKYEFIPDKAILDLFLTKTTKYKQGIISKSQYQDFPEKTVFLNFNYTDLIEYYYTEPIMMHHLGNHEIIYIHGELEDERNPIIFGFGDEMDKSYQEIEELNNNAYFEHIKSFQYLKTSNYQDLIRFLDGSTEGYEIYIIGHSCGLSDRTLLNHVFEHDNCKSIKIFYHKDLKGYTNTVYEISRHFNDKSKMRTKIVPFEKSIPTPQVQLKKKK